MHSNKKKIYGLATLIVVLLACKSALYMPTTENTVSGADIAKLQHGRELYINKCGSCHTLFAPEKYNKTGWEKWVNRMAPKAKLTEEEKIVIQAYLTKGE